MFTRGYMYHIHSHSIRPDRNQASQRPTLKVPLTPQPSPQEFRPAENPAPRVMPWPWGPWVSPGLPQKTWENAMVSPGFLEFNIVSYMFNMGIHGFSSMFLKPRFLKQAVDHCGKLWICDDVTLGFKLEIPIEELRMFHCPKGDFVCGTLANLMPL